MSQIPQIILRVIIKRIKNKTRNEIAEEQYGFMHRKGTRITRLILKKVNGDTKRSSPLFYGL